MSRRITRKKAYYLAKQFISLEKTYPILGHQICGIKKTADIIYTKPQMFGNWIDDKCIECIPHRNRVEFNALNELSVLVKHPEYIDFIFDYETLQINK